MYSILNRGYSEYEEITVQSSDAKKTTGKADAAASGGFKLIKISGGVEGGCEHEKMQSSGTTIKRVQTVTSILGNVLEEMSTDVYKRQVFPRCRGISAAYRSRRILPHTACRNPP